MNYAEIIIAAAKAAKVSGALLLAICTQETNLRNVTAYHDGPSHSYGICQVKFSTAKMLGFKGEADDLSIPYINAKWAANYLKYQEERYGKDNWVKLTSAYNAGSFLESKILVGCPKNMKYVKLVQKKLDENLKYKLSCRGPM